MSSPRRDIAEAEARMRVTFGTRTAIKNLHEIIADDETVQELAACLYAGSDGLLVLTNKRLIGVRDDYSKYHVRDHALAGVSKLDYDPVVHDGFAATTDTGRLVVRKTNADDGGRLVARLKELVPGLVVEVTRPGAHGQRVAVHHQHRPDGSPPPPDGSDAPPPAPAPPPAGPDAAGSGAPAGPDEPGAAGGDKGVLMGVLADLHAKGLLTDQELAAKLAQVAAQH